MAELYPWDGAAAAADLWGQPWIIDSIVVLIVVLVVTWAVPTSINQEGACVAAPA